MTASQPLFGNQSASSWIRVRLGLRLMGFGFLVLPSGFVGGLISFRDLDFVARWILIGMWAIGLVVYVVGLALGLAVNEYRAKIYQIGSVLSVLFSGGMILDALALSARPGINVHDNTMLGLLAFIYLLLEAIRKVILSQFVVPWHDVDIFDKGVYTDAEHNTEGVSHGSHRQTMVYP